MRRAAGSRRADRQTTAMKIQSSSRRCRVRPRSGWQGNVRTPPSVGSANASMTPPSRRYQTIPTATAARTAGVPSISVQPTPRTISAGIRNARPHLRAGTSARMHRTSVRIENAPRVAVGDQHCSEEPQKWRRDVAGKCDHEVERVPCGPVVLGPPGRVVVQGPPRDGAQEEYEGEHVSTLVRKGQRILPDELGQPQHEQHEHAHAVRHGLTHDRGDLRHGEHR